MKNKIGTRLLVLAGLLAIVLTSGCGSKSNSNQVPLSETIFFGYTILPFNNTLWASGNDSYGQLGNGGLATSIPTFAQVKQANGAALPLTNYAAGANHVVAFGNNSTLWVWGSNFEGRLGLFPQFTIVTGGSAYRPSPVALPMPNSIHAVAAGWLHSLALVGTNLYAWGGNGFGQLGISTLTDSYAPALVPLSGVQQIAAGGSHSLALRDDGTGSLTVWGWGYNPYGQTGQPNIAVNFAAPAQVPNFPPAGFTVRSIAAAGSYSLAVLDSVDPAGPQGEVWGWGYNAYGQLARNITTLNASPVPGPVELSGLPDLGAPLTGVLKLATGQLHVLALVRDLTNPLDKGTVYSWGDNEKGQLGLGVIIPGVAGMIQRFAAPVAVLQDPAMQAVIAASTSGITDIYATGNQSFVRIDSTWYGWGDNGWGQLGQPVPANDIAILLTPTKILGP